MSTYKILTIIIVVYGTRRLKALTYVLAKHKYTRNTNFINILILTMAANRLDKNKVK